MEFDTSDVQEVVPPVRNRAVTEPIGIDEEDMIEPACVLPPRRPRGKPPTKDRDIPPLRFDVATYGGGLFRFGS